MTDSLPKLPTDAELDAVMAKLHNDEAEWQRRAAEVQAKAAQAYSRLLTIAETSDTGQAGRIAHFLAGTFNGRAYPFDLYELRGLDVDLGDDALVCLDALRWGKSDLMNLVPDGMGRVKKVIETWGIKPANQ